MTEEEAKTKWCPFARPSYLDGPRKYGLSKSHRDYRPDDAPSFCIASACMAWRSVPENRIDLTNAPLDFLDGWRFSGWRIEQEINKITAVMPASGHCGLAGPP